MEAIVLDLQKEAYDSKSDVVALLRKAYVVARKLKLKEFGDWINEELNGYQSYEKTPDYRNVSGLLKGRDPYRGVLIPVLIKDPEFADIITKRKLVQAISEIESFVASEGNILLTFPVGQRELLSKAIGTETEYFLEVTKNQIGSIVDNVRNIVLEWSLKLEEEGILGEGMSFSKEEKEKAQNSNPITTIVHGNATGLQIQSQTSNSSQTMQQDNLDIQKVDELLHSIKEHMPQISLNNEQKETINANLETIEKQKQLKAPNSTIIREGFSTIRNVLEGVTGSIVASGLIHHLGLFLGS
ncbi:hypothetical protein PDK26_13295 [Bacillus cereus]|uniref:AbiTii domain-containing protein n=1 Tax=Bacillus cereus group TaxID=86661 RepID=UPI0009949E26|nr:MULTISPECIES: hypothetical protein [Bacillus cereus group]MDA1612201.1 hypothetical protein [Bacillus cereus]MDA2617915.1 hypothetical protein [Bacillus cereus]OOZ86866.1 hypothetical protein BHL25_13025 [Bacillus cereus]